MSKRIDLAGQTFGRLIALEYSHTVNSRAYWRCRCECGGCCTVRACNLKSSHTTSCGCYQRESVRQRVTSHGRCGSAEYTIWESMIQRCTNTNNKYYENYGGRGISVCPLWSSFEQFYGDVGSRPTKDHSLDRIDNDGPYCKENCRWATKSEQCNNRRSSRIIEHLGAARTLTEWSEMFGLGAGTVSYRLNSGWSVEKALTTPVRGRK